MHFVYLLASTKDKSWYIGYTTDLKARLVKHNEGGNLSTKARKPFKLIYYEAYLSKKDALGRETFLKSGAGHRFLKKQLKNYFEED